MLLTMKIEFYFVVFSIKVTGGILQQNQWRILSELNDFDAEKMRINFKLWMSD